MSKKTRYHVMILVGSLVVLLLSFLLNFNQHTVHIRGLNHMALPDVCFFKMATGWDCPFCGLTRSFVAIAHGQPHEAFKYHRLCFLALFIVVGQLPYRVALICHPGIADLIVMRWLKQWTVPIFIWLAAINWIAGVWI